MTIPQLPPDQDADFVPPYCPNHRCRFHLAADDPWPRRKGGVYTRRSDGARFQLYRCLECRRRFSTRAFCSDYWLRRRSLLPQVASLAANGTGLRQAGRHLRVTHSTISRHLARLGRHCLLFHRRMTRDLTIEEPVAFDGFETFEYSQYFPFHLNVAAGHGSWFLYEMTESPLRRKGRMTTAQKARRRELERMLGRPDPKAIEIGIERLISALLVKSSPDTALTLESDEHPAYLRVTQRLRTGALPCRGIDHRTTNSRRARTADNPLFAVNLTDLLLRHCQANHRRETIAFSKRRQGAMDRAHIFQVWRNGIKRRRENGDVQTAAMLLGLTSRPLEWEDVLRRRRFPLRENLEPWRMEYYRGEVSTPVFGNRQSRHELKRAF